MSDTVSTLAQKLRPFWLRDLGASTPALTGSGSGMIAHALNGPYHTGTLDASQAPWALTTTRTLTAGAGLTGGGDLSADRSFAVGAGLGITVNADDVALASSVAGAGLTYTLGVLAVGAGAGLTIGADDVALTTPGTLTVSSTNSSTGSHTHAVTASSSPGQATSLLKTGSNGELTLYNGFYTQGAQSEATFASGFAGSGWRADYGITTALRASMETDDLTVRGRMRVYELLIQQIRATNGSLFVSSASKVVTTSSSSNPLWTINGSQLTFNGQAARLTFTLYTISTAAAGDTSRELYHGFLANDLIRAQQVQWDGAAFAGVIQSNLEVTSITNLYTYGAAFVSGDAPAVGYDYVRLGNATNTARQGSVYITSDDSAAPFIDIVDGVYAHSLWNSANVNRVRVGKLSGISDAVFGGALSGYGLYGNNVYLKGQIVVTGGNLGGLAAADVNSNTTTINGGQITANSVTASQIAANTITAAKIAAGTITATEIAASTITADRLNITTLSAINANMGSLTSGSIVIGSTNKIWLNDSADGALNIGGSTKASAPFRVTAAGALTATSATVSGDFSVASSTFGNAGVQMQYNGGSPRFYVGDGANAYLKYETATGYPIASGIYIQGASYVTGSVYAGNGNVRLSTDGQRLKLSDLAAPNLKTTIPTNSSAVRWFAGITDTWTNAANYTGQISYRDTTNPVVDWVAMSYVGSTDYATYYARTMLYANRYNGSTDKECRLEVAVDPGAGGAYITAVCDTMYTTANLYVTSNCSAQSFTDRTPHFEGDALAELRQVRGATRTVRGKAVKEIDHASLPVFARKTIEHRNGQTEQARDLGAMISILVVAVQQLDARLDALEGRGNGRQ